MIKDHKCIKIPVKILTKKIPARLNSIFYDGKDIAKVKIRDREYLLTTAGEYIFDIGSTRHTQTSKVVEQLTDHKIRVMNGNDDIHNWGWFGITIWGPQKIDKKGNYYDVLVGDPDVAYSTYDEALDGFQRFVERDIIR